MKSNNFNKKVFFTWLFLFLLLAAITSMAMAALEKGTGGEGFITNLLASLYFIFRFPAHQLFWHFFSSNGAFIFYSGLFLNCIFYALLIERISSLIKKRKN